VGDVHGAFEQLLQIVAACPANADIWQMGDIWHSGVRHPGNPGAGLPPMGPRFKFLRGNHDNPALAAIHPNYAGAFGYEPRHRMFYMSGAPSQSLGPESELSTEQLEAAHRKYVETKPEIVLSHTAPSGILVMLCKETNKPKREHECQSRTSQMLHKMLLAHQPRFFCFAHFHVDWQKVLTTHGGKATQFVCCDRLREGQPAKVFVVPEQFNAPKADQIILAPASA
jgi:hypothetical protein